MKEGSAIVNISSVHAHETTKNVVPYATSKGGMEAFTRGFSEELADRKIRINCVAPGAVNTPMLWTILTLRVARRRWKVPLGSRQIWLLPFVFSCGRGGTLHHRDDVGSRRWPFGHPLDSTAGLKSPGQMD